MTVDQTLKKIIGEKDLCLDYSFLSRGKNVEKISSTLDQFLEEAADDFAELLTVKEVNFENVVERFLNLDELMGRLFGWIHHLNSVANNEVTRKIISEFQPKYVAFNTQLSLSRDFYDLLCKVDQQSLDDQQMRSWELIKKGMEMAGVHLEAEKKTELEKLNLQLAELSEQFSNNVIDSRQKFHYCFKNLDSLADMPEQDLAMAAHEAEHCGEEGWVFTLSPPSLLAVMKYCSDQDVREKFYQEAMQIATKGEQDNRSLVAEILKLRRAKAELMGHADFPTYVLQDRMADNVDQIVSTIEEFKVKARKKGEKDIQELADFAGVDRINPWDIAFNARKLKEQKFAIDERELKKFFPLSAVLAGMFAIVGNLYDLEFQEMEMASYHDEVRTFEVWKNGKKIAYFLIDLFARKEKRPGAWCNTLRSARRLTAAEGGGKQLPIVINVSNFGKAKDGQETLLTHGEVVTMFHEFGHGIHMILGRGEYNNLGSMSVEWDFVEFPSQLLENWCWEKESLAIFAAHVETGENLSDEMLNALKATRTFMSGYHVARQNEFALLDLKIHAESKDWTVAELDQWTLAHSREVALVELPDYYRMYASFSHIFSGGYAAGYYSYLWAEILEADVFEVFKEQGLLSAEVGQHFAEKILARGATKPGMAMFCDFMGRKPKTDALLKKLGLEK